MGGTMRLGAYPCELREGTKAFAAYGEKQIEERHRHRYEFNNAYRERLEQVGLIVSGTYKHGEHELVEIAELKDHPWFCASQFHHDDRVIGDAQVVEQREQLTDLQVMLDHPVGVLVVSLVAMFGLDVRAEVHARTIPPAKERFAGVVLALDEVLGDRAPCGLG
jgi:hypothetical protein